MNPKRISSTVPSSFLAFACLFVSACESNRVWVGGPKENRIQRLAGEWISPSNPNDYLVFKPDPVEARQGRILGLDKYENYRITALSSITANLTLELSARDDVWEERKGTCTVAYSKDGKGINVTLPPAQSSARPVTRYYRASSTY